MSRGDYERWAQEWDTCAGEPREMPVGVLMSRFKQLTMSGNSVHFFRPVWPGDVDERQRIEWITATIMTNYADLYIMPTTRVGPDAWTKARNLEEYCRVAWTGGFQGC